MRALLSVTALLLIVFAGCNSGSEGERCARMADSLAESVQAGTLRLDSPDTSGIQQMLVSHQAWLDFIARSVRDTLTMEQAGALQQFDLACRQLEAFLSNRRILLARSALLRSQLMMLAADVRSGSLDAAKARGMLEQEKKEAGTFLALCVQQVQDTEKALGQFSLSRDMVSDLVRDHNGGELPVVVPETPGY